MFSQKSSRTPAEKVRLKLDGVNIIAPFPHVVGELISATKSVETDVASIVSIIEQDAALTLKTLRIANSPIYGLANVVQSVRHAISLLGFSKIRSMALTYAASSVMLGKGPTQAFKKDLWKHSLGCATVARKIATLIKHDPDEAFLGGIFHDVGKLFLIDVLPDEYNQLCAEYSGAELISEELKLLETDHQQVGIVLATEWQLPELLKVIVGNHHNPESAIAHERVCQIVSVADSVTRYLIEENDDEAEIQFCEEAASALGITAELIEEVLSDSVQAFEDATVACS